MIEFRDYSLITDDDLYLFNEGSHFRLYEKLGAHRATVSGKEGVYFSVWAPNAEQVSVIGDFNQWDETQHSLRSRNDSGIWEGFFAGIGKGARYKFRIRTKFHGYVVDKADPFAIYAEVPPDSSSVVWDLDYAWGDHAWMEERHAHNSMQTPMAIYEVHLGSWQRVPEENHRPLTYRELAPRLADHVKRTGFTHVEFLPVMEHPFYGSWGYQITGFFAPTSRYGTPQDFMYLIDYLHQMGIGVILDWVPSHFPNDEHGLTFFDGTHLYEHEDPRQGMHPDWNTSIFNYGRNEIRAFLISNGLYWLDRFHVDGVRMDAVASMLYLDYSRAEGEWIPNHYGGRENLEAVDFIRRFNLEAYRAHPGIQTIAEESTAWPMTTKPTYVGGLGFGYKWDMGWMHDTLKYMSMDPIFRKYHHNELTFRSLYSFSENFVLPLSHDEVVHGKGSLIAKMPGDDWQRFANLRLLLAMQSFMPGKALLFMGAELAQRGEWAESRGLDWHLLDHAPHRGVQRLVGDLNRLVAATPALHELDFDQRGFQWIDCHDNEQSVFSWLRIARDGTCCAIVLNCTPVPRGGYHLGLPRIGRWRETLNTDSAHYGGSNVGNEGYVDASSFPWMGQPARVRLTLPPLAAIVLMLDGDAA